MKPLRIVTLVNRMSVGGAQASLLRLAEGLRHRGHEVETWFLHQITSAYVDRPGARSIYPRPITYPWDYLRVWHRLWRDMERYHPDVVISFLPLSNVMGSIAARRHGVCCRLASQRNPGWTYGRTMRVLDAMAGTLGFYTDNIMLSRAVFDSFSRYPKAYLRRCHVIHNGLIFPRTTLSKNSARQFFNLPTDRPLIVHTGRMHDQKNQAALIRAMVPMTNGALLAVAGTGPLEGTLRRLVDELAVRDRVLFVGELDADQVPIFLAAGDLFATTSVYEGLSNSLLEALAAGLPIVASLIPAYVEVLTPPGGSPVGPLLPPHDVTAWTATLSRVLGDSALRNEMSAASTARSAAFSLEKMVDRYEQVFAERLDHTP